jgi:hypothetical protein
MAQPVVGLLDTMRPACVEDPLLRGCHLWLLMLPHRQAMGSTWRSLVGNVHGTPINFLPQPTATRGLANQTTRRGGYGEMRLPGTNVGAEGGVQFPNDTLQFLEGLSIAFWVNLPATPDSAAHRFVAAGATTATRAYGIFNNASATTLRFNWGGTDRLSTTTALGTGTWRHVVVTRTGTLATSLVARWHIDGLLDATSSAITADPTTNAGDYTTIGCRADGNLLPNALMDDIMIYDRPLTPHEVAALWQDGLRGHPRLLNAPLTPQTMLIGGRRVRTHRQLF